MFWKKITIISLNIAFLFTASGVESQEEVSLNKTTREPYLIRLDDATIKRGFTVSAYDGALKLSLTPGILAEDTQVAIEEIPSMEMPWRLERVSPIFQFEFANKKAYQYKKPFYIELRTTKRSNLLKQVFFYDKNIEAWRPLPTRDYPNEFFVRSLIHLPYARIAVFSYPDAFGVGEASWYAHKPGMYAASPDFPKGSIVRVRRLDTNTFVDVTINDYGPDRARHPGRAIDLERRAFAALAPTGSGIIRVALEPIKIATRDGTMPGIGSEGIGAMPAIASKAAFAFDASSGDVLYEKNADEALPIASLSKIVASRVFLETRPSLDTVIAYSKRDEQLNYQYVEHAWEAAKLNVKDGETLTVENLFYAALVGSANNAVESLVRVSGLPRGEFIESMNAFARLHGLKTTHFDDPAGLSPRNVSSARDFAFMARAAFSHPIIQKASTMERYSFSTLNTGVKHTIKNTDRLLVTEPFQFTGSKTGYLHEAGYCLVTSIATDTTPIIAVTLGDATRTKSIESMKTLLYFAKQERAKRKMKESLTRARLHSVAARQ